MMRFIEECVGCRDMGLPCIYPSCHQGYVERICDWCDCEVDTLYDLDGDEVCADCLLGSLEKREETDEYETLYHVGDEWLVDTDALGEFNEVEYE